MNRRLALSFLGALALSASLGCSSKGDKPADAAGKTHVKLVLNWVPEPEFGGFYQARDGKDYDKQGLDVEIMGGGAGVPVLQMVATGQADFGISGADEVLTAKARGADVVAVMAVFQKSPQGIMAHEEKATKLADVFAGGTLAIEPGLTYALFLKKKYGFDRVKIVPYDGGVAQFVADKDFSQQCYVTSEPIAARRKQVKVREFLVADEGFNPYMGVVIAKRSTWLEKKDLVKKFVSASRDGWQAYLKDASAANETMQKLNPSMDKDTFKEAAEVQKKLIAPEDGKALGAMTKDRWEKLASQLVEIGVLDKAPNVDEIFAQE
jgi:NitT/TauT family transport system substrate-binding protein